MSDIKILITYKKESKILKSKILCPIQTGTVLSSDKFSEMYYDNTGKNISKKNEIYCELTAHYWALYNMHLLENPKYIGFMHYRRHFLFDNWKGNDKLRWLPKINYFCYPFIDKRYLSHLTDNLICKVVENYDIIVPYPYDVKFCGSFNIREQISKLLPDYLLSFDLFINILCSELQEYKDEIKKIESGSIQFCCNMFICKTEIFQKYCKILFDILEELETELSRIYGDQINNSRILGYYGELLWSIFIFKEIKEGRSKIKFLNCSYIVDNFKKYTETQFLFLNRFEFLIKLFGKKVRYNYELMKLVYK